MNFINKAPTYIQLLIYYDISILLGDINYLEANQTSYDEIQTFNNYNITYNKDLYSLFAELVLRNPFLGIHNIHAYMTAPLVDMQNLLAFENKLDESNMCNTVVAIIKNFFPNYNEKQGMCEYSAIGSGINNNRFDDVYYAFIDNLNKKYLDFKRSINKNIVSAISDIWVLRNYLQADHV
jgi:hypothetical protein